MTTLAGMLKQNARKPIRVCVLPPSAFADSWEQKPQAEVAVGLRLLSEQQFQRAAAEATKSIEKLGLETSGPNVDADTIVDAWNNRLVELAVAYAACDPNDAARPYIEYAEDMIPVALTPEGIRLLWDALSLLHVEESPASSSITDEEAVELGAMLSGGILASMTGLNAMRARRLLIAAKRLMASEEKP